MAVPDGADPVEPAIEDELVNLTLFEGVTLPDGDTLPEGVTLPDGVTLPAGEDGNGMLVPKEGDTVGRLVNDREGNPLLGVNDAVDDIVGAVVEFVKIALEPVPGREIEGEPETEIDGIDTEIDGVEIEIDGVDTGTDVPKEKELVLLGYASEVPLEKTEEVPTEADGVPLGVMDVFGRMVPFRFDSKTAAEYRSEGTTLANSSLTWQKTVPSSRGSTTTESQSEFVLQASAQLSNVASVLCPEPAASPTWTSV